MTQGKVFVTGCTSAIGRAIATELGLRGYDLLLAGRQIEEVYRVAADVHTRTGVSVSVAHFDAGTPIDAALSLKKGIEASFPLKGAVFVHGFMGDQELAKVTPTEARKHFDVNLTSTVELTSLLMQQHETLEFICFTGSVAGDRGRKSNYVYGAAKAAIEVYAEGLRHELSGKGTTVTLIKPGFVDTRMTYGKPGIFLAASPKVVGVTVVQAIEKRRNVVYVPKFWALIMLVIRLVPRWLFHRLNI